MRVSQSTPLKFPTSSTGLSIIGGMAQVPHFWLEPVSDTICNAPMEGPNHMAYTSKGLVNDTIGAPLEPYKE